jgi:hypothetical protein
MDRDTAILRKRKYARELVSVFDLDLSGLSVYTEAATGNYMYTAMIALLAGAAKVYAIAGDSRYGTRESVKLAASEEAMSLGIAENLEIVFTRNVEDIADCDIITNSGFVRPIDKEMITCMKPTAVVPLMWETWEFREEDLDLQECNRRGILVLGTNERHPLVGLFDSLGFIASKMLLDNGFDVYKDKLLIFSSGYVGECLCNYFLDNRIACHRVVFDDIIPDNQKGIVLSKESVEEQLDLYDAIIIAENYHNVDILSDMGFISAGMLKQRNPLVQLLHMCGNINPADIYRHNLSLYPGNIAGFGYMSVSAEYIGFKSTMTLNAAGLKVGELMARSRLKGLSVEDSRRAVTQGGLAMDFR